ncbi:MAG: methyltransferase domain-containing protein [archaeon GB-1867-005]|nr:methyltransferase domain-containing protein [Candidatus Culexmicrobium cathedralense]
MIKRQVKVKYDTTAPSYDELYGEEQKRKYNAIFKEFGSIKGKKVLDAGCGTGILMEQISPKCNYVVGVDISSGMLKIAKRKLKGKANASLILADVENLPVKRRQFDLALAITLIQNTPNPQRALKELREALSENGTLIFTGMKKLFTPNSLKKLAAQSQLKIMKLINEKGVADVICICKSTSGEVESHISLEAHLNHH